MQKKKKLTKDEFEAMKGIRWGLESKRRGEGLTLEEFNQEMRRQYQIPARPK